MATNANTLAELIAQMRKAQADRLVDYFHGKHTRGKGPAKQQGPGNEDAATLTVHNWAALKLMRAEPPTAEMNPGGADFQQALIPELDAAVDAEDAKRTWEILWLVAKVLRHG